MPSTRIFTRVAVALGLDGEQHRRARLQQIAACASVSEKITASNCPVVSENMAKANLLPFCDAARAPR